MESNAKLVENWIVVLFFTTLLIIFRFRDIVLELHNLLGIFGDGIVIFCSYYYIMSIKCIIGPWIQTLLED